MYRGYLIDLSDSKVGGQHLMQLFHDRASDCLAGYQAPRLIGEHCRNPHQQYTNRHRRGAVRPADINRFISSSRREGVNPLRARAAYISLSPA